MKNDRYVPKCRIVCSAILCVLTWVFFFQIPAAQAASDTQTSDDSLIEQFIRSQGLSQIIVFDARNIKQFWTSNSVSSQNDLIHISLNKENNQKWKSSSLKIQLANVIETQDCRIDVITNDKDLNFIVSDSQSKALSSSSDTETFIQYHIASTSFHLDDTPDFSFNLVFSSKNKDLLSIKKIILSFSDNNESRYVGSPGFYALSKLIEKDGCPVPNSNVKYIISKEHNKIFIMIPQEQLEPESYFYYHIYPINESDLRPGSVEYKFNNNDFSMTTRNLIIPRPYGNDNKVTIIQRSLPPYRYSLIKIGQSSSSSKYPWKIELHGE